MTTKGRKPKPTTLRLLNGNAGKRPLNKSEPVIDMPMPEAPSHLSETAVKEWDRVVEELSASGMLTGLDMGALAAYSQAYGRWVDAEGVLAKMGNTAEGLIIKTVSGNYIQNPIVGVANKAMSDMVRFASEFGMTPSARSRVVVSKSGEKKNGFKEMNELK